MREAYDIQQNVRASHALPVVRTCNRTSVPFSEVASSRVRTEVRNRAAAALEHRQHWSSTHKPELNAEIISLTALRT